jgi:hypothetical protein
MAYLELCIKGDEAGWCESQSKAVCQREPVPVLGEHQNSDHRKHVGVACTWLQRHCYVTTTCNHKTQSYYMDRNFHLVTFRYPNDWTFFFLCFFRELCNDTDSIKTTQYQMVWLVMNDELGKIWKGAIMAYLRYYLGICLEGLRKNPQKTELE